jgi:hypothetical protein
MIEYKIRPRKGQEEKILVWTGSMIMGSPDSLMGNSFFEKSPGADFF